MAKQATRLLESQSHLILTDVVAAEFVYVLKSFYEVGIPQIAQTMRAAFALPAVDVPNMVLLLRTLEVLEQEHIGFADAYLVANAEVTGVGEVASFDKSIDRIRSVRRVT